MRGRSLHEIGSSVAAGEAFGDYLGCETEVGTALCAVEVGGVAVEELIVWGDDDGGGGGGWYGCGGACEGIRGDGA